MTFYVQGLSAHELMPLESVFKNPAVEKMEAIIPERAIDEKEPFEHKKKQGHKQSAVDAYQSVSALPQRDNVVSAEQIMSFPVVSVSVQAVIADVLTLFRVKRIRHVPVVSSAGQLVGMVSERDVLHHLSGVTDNYQRQKPHNEDEPVTTLMKSPVLTASADTDVRYIARLFVERRVGALPIVTGGELTGIISRSDVLSAVMRHFVLELWA